MDIINRYNKLRKQTIDFCNRLEPEDFAIQVATFASPAKWHLGHTTWFFETFVLENYAADYSPFNSDFNFLFNSYYNNVGDRILQSNRGNMSRPATVEIYRYRDSVDRKMSEILEQEKDPSVVELVILGINHEQQHQELLITDVKYMLGHNPLFPSLSKDYSLINDLNENSNKVEIEAGVYEIGYQGNEFCYDNELGAHKVFVEDFEIDNFLVTNGEFIEFIESGAYADFNLWLDEGWSWIQVSDIRAPLYWHKFDGDWYQYTLAGLKKVEPSAPVCHISFYEANAYAEWIGMRLPTEFEWEIASRELDWGMRWEWTNSAYLPYPNFEKSDGAIGEYNGKFMSNKMVLRGASVATSENHSRPTYRNFFAPIERWQYTGIRLAK